MWTRKEWVKFGNSPVIARKYCDKKSSLKYKTTANNHGYHQTSPSKQIEVKNSVNNLKRSQRKFSLQLIFIVINLSQQDVFWLLYFITKYGYKTMVN